MKKVCLLFAVLAVLVCFVLGFSRVEQGQRLEDIRQLEEAIRRTAAACYAAEGQYPPDLYYMRQHYGLQYDETRFQVHYGVFASNLMPDITVLEK